MSYSDIPEFHFAASDRLRELSDEFYAAKMAERELKQTRKVIYLLLKHIGVPFVIDKAVLMTLPDDTNFTICQHPDGTVTLNLAEVSPMQDTP